MYLGEDHKGLMGEEGRGEYEGWAVQGGGGWVGAVFLLKLLKSFH